MIEQAIAQWQLMSAPERASYYIALAVLFMLASLVSFVIDQTWAIAELRAKESRGNEIRW